jgi:hypothetical protein
MRLRQLACSLACLIQSSSAFYPYRLNLTALDDTSSTPPSRRQAEQPPPSLVRAPLRRILKKRNNNFNVVHSNTPPQSNIAPIDQDGSDISYLCSLQIGSGKKVFYMLLDTAASNTWVMSTDCKTDACAAHSTFGPADSTSLQV